MIEIYGSVENALLIQKHLDAYEIKQLLEDTSYLRKDPKDRDKEDVVEQWTNFQKQTNIFEITDEVTGEEGTQQTIQDLLTFKG